MTLRPFLEEYYFGYSGDAHNKTEQWIQTRAEFTHLVEELLEANEIALAKTGPNIDSERKPIDTIVVHHSATSRNEDFNLTHIEALCLIRIFAPVHGNPSSPEYQQPIWSNHFYQDHQTFIVYHYLIWPNGRIDHVLNDKQIGWQAGNWEVNCRSIAICFVGDFQKVPPSSAALNAAAQIVKKYPNATIEPHSAINHSTVCPGEPFSTWKKQLVSAQ